MWVADGYAQTVGEGGQRPSRGYERRQCSGLPLYARTTQIARESRGVQAFLRFVVRATRAPVPRGAYWLPCREQLSPSLPSGQLPKATFELRPSVSLPHSPSSPLSRPLSLAIVFAVSNMVNWKFSSLLLLSLRALGSFAAEVLSRVLLRDIKHPLTPPQAETVKEAIEDPKTPNLNVKVSVSFPQAEIFGVKLINGHATQARLSISNNEPESIGLSLIAGSLSHEAAGEPQIVRNLTAQKYSIEIPAGQEETVPYTFTTDLHPRELRLQLVTVLRDGKNNFYTVPVYNETVTVVEKPTSLFDPQMYVPASTNTTLITN
jgi:hypothetical protein